MWFKLTDSEDQPEHSKLPATVTSKPEDSKLTATATSEPDSKLLTTASSGQKPGDIHNL